MKTLFRAIVVAAFAASIITRGVAQDTPPPAVPTNPAPAEPTVAAPTKAPAVKRAARPTPKAAEARADVKSEPILHPEPGISRQNNVNVRGQAAINSEVIAHLQKNQPITLLEEITLKKAKQDEPARWFRIALPTNVGVWVHSSFVDEATKTVKARRLNVRSGPGENYSILGRLESGTVVNQLEAKNNWLKIEAPTNSYAFVAAHLVERAPAPAIVAAPTAPTPTPTPTPAPTPVPTPDPITPPPVVAEVTPTTPEIAPAAPVTPPAAETTTPPASTPPPVAVVPAPAEVLPDAPIEKVKKIVSREGLLRGSVSIQAPSHYELRSLDTGKTINYVFSPSTNLMLREYKGKRIIVSGEELLDERWQSTPVIIIDSFEVVP